MTKVIILSELVANIRCRRNGKTFLANFVNQCEFSNAIIIPPNATNGDMIKAMFPNAKVSAIFPSFNGDEVYYVSIEKVGGVTIEMRVMKSWWNAPFKGSEVSIAQSLLESEG